MSTAKEGATPAPKKPRTSKKDQAPPAPAPILDGTAAPVAPAVEAQAMTSEGVAELPPDRALAYSLHKAGLADRLTFLAAVDEEAVLVAVQALLVADGDPHLAAEVGDRLADLRRGRADAAGVPREATIGLLARGVRYLPVRLFPAEHEAARIESVTLAQQVLEAEREEAARSSLEKSRIKRLRGAWEGVQQIAAIGEEIRPVDCEITIRGSRAVQVRTDTGEIIEDRPASADEIERVSQLPLWRS